MSITKSIQDLLDSQTVESTLKWKSPKKSTITDLQHILCALGFKTELKWEQWGADGDFGSGTVAALIAFGNRNGISTDGQSVSSDLAKLILRRFNLTDDLRRLKTDLDEGSIPDKYKRKSSEKLCVTALQILLNELGYGAQLNWEKFGADGDYGSGTVTAIKAFADAEGIFSDGENLSDELATKILEKFLPFYGDAWFEGNPDLGKKGNLHVHESGGKVTVSDGSASCKFSKLRRGYYRISGPTYEEYAKDHFQELDRLGISESSMNIMAPVFANEGTFSSINTYDSNFMSLGMFQWTLGAKHDKGELPALLKKIKEKDPDAFEENYGQLGLDVVDTSSTYGYLSLDGSKINTSSLKEQFRSPEWAFYFWRSGQDPRVQAIQVEHAVSRLKNFYWSNKANGHVLSELVTSEYGVALILDNHVNRPAYVKTCLGKAMNQTGLSNPSSWTTADENRLIDAYCQIRRTHGSSPMTHAAKRERVTKDYLNRGQISDARGSFRYDAKPLVLERGLGVSKSPAIGTPPSAWHADMYPMILEDKGEMMPTESD